MRTQVFISYRRNDGLKIAKDIFDHLNDKYEVFFDMESLRNGRFDLKIEEAIRKCTDFILILSNQIFSRFEDDGDWISRELALAIKGSKNIIPVFADDFVQPATSNQVINTVLNYNGIRYSDEKFYDCLANFLKSSKKCVLNIECDQTGYKVGSSAIEELKEVYRKTRYTKEYGVHIILNFPDLNMAGDHLVCATLTGQSRDSTVKNKILHLLNAQQRYRERLECAIEYMIADTCNIEGAPLWNVLKDEPLANEHYFDKNGAIQSYFPVCVWIHIIHELLKEITLASGGRYNQYANVQRDEYVKIDCIRCDKPTWSFTSFAKREECDKSVAYYQASRISPFCLDPKTILTMILPDFYYKVAHDMLYLNNEKLNQDLMDPECTIRILECYWFGLA